MGQMGKVALITGITGQDGSYLAEFLLEKGYQVHGLIRHSNLEDMPYRPSRIHHLLDRIVLHPCPLTSYISVQKIIQNILPDEVYHLAAQSYVSYAFEAEFDTIHTNIMATHHLLAVLREICPETKLFFPGTSEMFGHSAEFPQTERTPFNPRSIYGISKLAAYHLVKNYREQFNLRASVGIMYNHESPRRGHQYVTRKVTSYVAKLKLGLISEPLKLGNLTALRDWGYAPDYVKAMWLMLQQGQHEDYVVATGKTHSVKDLLEVAFGHVGLSYREHVVTDPQFYRKEEKIPLCGHPRKIREKLGWNPLTNFEEMIVEMVESDLKEEKK